MYITHIHANLHLHIYMPVFIELPFFILLFFIIFSAFNIKYLCLESCMPHAPHLFL